MTPHPTIDAILDAAAARYGVSPELLLTKRHAGRIGDAKALAALLMQRLRGMSLHEIRFALGYSSTSGVIGLLKRAEELGLMKEEVTA